MSFKFGIDQNIEGNTPVHMFCFEASEFLSDFPLTSDLRARFESKRLLDLDKCIAVRRLSCYRPYGPNRATSDTTHQPSIHLHNYCSLNFVNSLDPQVTRSVQTSCAKNYGILNTFEDRVLIWISCRNVCTCQLEKGTYLFTVAFLDEFTEVVSECPIRRP